MSGFFGMNREDGQAVSEALLEEVADTLRFRGPDGMSIGPEERLGACVARMRTGPAPQAEQLPAEIGSGLRMWGDIRLDEREELGAQLGEYGARAEETKFRRGVLVGGQGEVGATALEKLVGDFSCALWDQRTRTLWCAPDFSLHGRFTMRTRVPFLFQ